MQNSTTTLQPDPALQNTAPALDARQAFLDKYQPPLKLEDLQEIEFIPASVVADLVTHLAMEWRSISLHPSKGILKLAIEKLYCSIGKKIGPNQEKFYLMVVGKLKRLRLGTKATLAPATSEELEQNWALATFNSRRNIIKRLRNKRIDYFVKNFSFLSTIKSVID